MAALPTSRRQAIEAGLAATVREIEGLEALSQLTRHSEEQIVPKSWRQAAVGAED